MSTTKMHANEIDIGIPLVAKLISDQFPQWASLPIKRVTSAGTDNAIFQLGPELCVRMPRIENAAKNIEMQHAWLPKLAPHLPLPIPVAIEKGKPDENYPWHWSICEWLPGENVFNQPILDLHECAVELASFLLNLQKINSDGGPISHRSNILMAQDDDVKQSLKQLGGLLNVDAANVLWKECLSAPLWDKAPVWTHGDLLPTNLLVKNGKLSAVIDFDLMGIGDPACDTIVAWSVLSKDTRNTFRKMLAIDDATWIRGRGWALSIALTIIPYYLATNRVLVSIAQRMINEIFIDEKIRS